MVKVLIYAYATGTFSSRKMAKKLEEDVAFRMLAAGNFPKHRTLCEFRKRHLGDFRAVFAEVVLLARALGLAGLGRVSVDGTKVRANASKRKAMSYGRMVKEEPRLEEEIRALKAEIQALVERAEAVDEAEDERYGEEARGDELPDELKRREDRLAAIRAAKALLEEEQKAKDDARGPQAGTEAQPEGRPALQAEVRRAGREGAEQLHRSGEPDHEDEYGGVPRATALIPHLKGREKALEAFGWTGGRAEWIA